MATFTAVFDACVLYPAPLRDFLMQLSLLDLFRARWTEDIHEEWISNLLEKRKDLTRQQLERTRELMNHHVLDCLVTGYEDLIPGLALPDPGDRHVLAAAIRANAAVIVTFNLSDFPADYLSQFGVEAQHPDDFIRHLVDLAPERVYLSAKLHRARLRNPAMSPQQYLATLANQQLPETVSALEKYAGLI